MEKIMILVIGCFLIVAATACAGYIYDIFSRRKEKQERLKREQEREIASQEYEKKNLEVQERHNKMLDRVQKNTKLWNLDKIVLNTNASLKLNNYSGKPNIHPFYGDVEDSLSMLEYSNMQHRKMVLLSCPKEEISKHITYHSIPSEICYKDTFIVVKFNGNCGSTAVMPVGVSNYWKRVPSSIIFIIDLSEEGDEPEAWKKYPQFILR